MNDPFKVWSRRTARTEAYDILINAEVVAPAVTYDSPHLSSIKLITIPLGQIAELSKMTLRAQQEELVRRVCTEYLNIPDIPLAKKQRSTTGDAPAKGPVWISRTTFRAPPEQDLKDALHQVCTRLSSRDQDIPEPHLIPTREVGVEFIGIRDGLGAPAPEPQIPEERKLELLQETCENDFTILYLHGGGM